MFSDLIWPMPRLSPSRLPVITQGFRPPGHLGVDVMFRWTEGDPRVAPFTACNRKGRPIYSVPRLNIPIMAIGDGTVLYAKLAANGWRTRVELDSGLHVLDLHMTRVVVRAGTRVKQGDVLGMCGGDPTDKPDHLIHDHHEHRERVPSGLKQADGYGCVPIDPEPALAKAIVLEFAVLA